MISRNKLQEAYQAAKEFAAHAAVTLDDRHNAAPGGMLRNTRQVAEARKLSRRVSKTMIALRRGERAE